MITLPRHNFGDNSFDIYAIPFGGTNYDLQRTIFRPPDKTLLERPVGLKVRTITYTSLGVNFGLGRATAGRYVEL